MSSDKFPSSFHSIEAKLEEGTEQKELYNSNFQDVTKSYLFDGNYGNTPFQETSVSIPTLQIEDHPVHQNQLKPTREIVIPQRTKVSTERNVTDVNVGSSLDKAVINQFEQKIKNILKSDKTLLTGTESERRVQRGVKLFTRKDLPKAIDSLKLLELNTSIGQEYCNTLQCAHGSGPRFSYLIPVSKFMAEEYLTLQFNLAVPLIVDHCQPDSKPIACLARQNGAGDLPHDYIREQNLTEEVDPSWRLPIGLYLRSTYRFRVQARTVISDTPCTLPPSELGHSYIEFILVFQRTCDK